MAHADRWIDSSDLEDDERFDWDHDQAEDEDDYDEMSGGELYDQDLAAYDEYAD
jgi:hypothetical protein